MRWLAASSTQREPAAAVAEVAARVRGRGAPPDVLFAFFTPHHEPARLASLLVANVGASVLSGCVGAAVIGEGVALEGVPGLSVLAGWLPECTVRAAHVAGAVEPAALAARLGGAGDALAIVLADPLTVDAPALVSSLAQALPGAVIAGGLAAGAGSGGRHAIVAEGAAWDGGTSIVTITGVLDREAFVAQGTRPIGQALEVTRARGGVVYQLGDEPAVVALERVLTEANGVEREAFRRGPLVGVAPAGVPSRRPGDMLVRNLAGLDTSMGSLSVAWPLAEGDLLQFQVRDAGAARQELSSLLGRRRTDPALAALVFSCVGRGSRFFGEPGYDAQALAKRIGESPMAGFMGNGEIGAIRGRPVVHQFAASYLLLREGGWN